MGWEEGVCLQAELFWLNLLFFFFFFLFPTSEIREWRMGCEYVRFGLREEGGEVVPVGSSD